MKIKGPGGPTGPGDVGGLDKTDKIKVTGFADKLDEAKGPTGPGGPGGPDPIAQVAADLKAGKITPQQAVDRIVSLAVDNGPAAGLPDKVREKLRADVEKMIAEDPFLAGKARRIGVDLPKDDE